MLQGALNDLKNACAMPRYCSPDEVKSIAQLNRLLDKDAITPNHLLEELIIGGGVGKIVGAGISSLAARVFGEVAASTAGTVGINTAVKLDQITIDGILSTGKGLRPDPATYLSRDFINSHLAQFDSGVTKLSSSAPSGVVGPPGGTFVIPKSLADSLITQSGGNVTELERLLSLKSGTLGTNPVRIDIPSPKGLRIPSGNELGANKQWLPGGFTGGGIPEAIINPAKLGTYTVNPIFH